MKNVIAAVIVMGGIAGAGSAFAQDKAACVDAASKAQVLRDAHKLVETRTQLRICAHPECPTVVQQDCATWLAEVERGLPSVVLSATDDTGASLVNVKVTIDGRVVASQLDGVAIPLDPGSHRVRMEAVSGAFYDRLVTLKEGEQKRPLAVVLARPAEDTPPDVAPKRVDPPPDDAPAEAPPVESRGSGLRVAGFIVGGVGLAGLALGTAFGVLAMDSKTAAVCTTDGYCQPGPLADARANATVSTVGFVAGGVLLATGLTLVLVAPKSVPSASALRVEVSPSFGTSYAGLLAGGRW